jgi:hypothetical protein
MTRFENSKFGFLAALAVLMVALPVLADESTSPQSPAGPKHSLQYKFKPGETVRTKVLQQVRLDTTIEGSTQVAETVSGSVKLWKILGVDAKGQTTLEHSVESVDMRQKVSGRQEVVYNSKTDTKPPPGFEAVAKSVGVPLADVTVDRAGKITKRVEKRPGAQSDSQSQMLVPLPPEPVAVGESWNEPVDVVVSLEDGEKKLIKTRQHYTLEKVANGVATLSVATQILTPTNNPKIQSQLVQRLTKGSIRFDIDAGRVLSQQIDLDERVLGFQGNNSSLHYLGRFTEEYQPGEIKSAAKLSKLSPQTSLKR